MTVPKVIVLIPNPRIARRVSNGKRQNLVAGDVVGDAEGGTDLVHAWVAFSEIAVGKMKEFGADAKVHISF